MSTASIVFTVEELWLLHDFVRHEVSQGETWKFPPASLELNDQIAETILFCAEEKAAEAALLLSRGDCLVLDFCVPSGAKSAKGEPIGRNVLLKSFAARRTLAGGPMATADEPERSMDIDAALEHAALRKHARGKGNHNA